MVSDYAGLSMAEITELDVFNFWALMHDAVIYNHAQTEEGRKWLKNAHRLEQTEPDDDALHRKYG